MADKDQDGWEDVPLKGQADDGWEDVPLKGAANVPSPQPQGDMLDRFATNYAIPALQTVGQGAVGAVGSFAQAVDKYGGAAALRSALMKVAEGKPGEALPAAYAQYGEDPTLAPSGKQLAAKAGLSTREFATPFILNPFAKGDQGKLKVSPAGLVGGLGEAVVDPVNVIPAGKMAQGAAYLARKGVVAPIAKAGEIAAPLVGKAAFRIPTETTRAFMENPSRIEAAAKMYTAEDLKDIIDQTVSGAKRDVQTITEQRDLAREALKQKLRDKKFELEKRDPNTDVVFKIQEQMEGPAKAKLRQMSEVADDYLAKSQIKIPKRYLLDFADQVADEMSDVTVGMGVRDALKKWQSYRDELAAQPNVINGTRMRKIMRQIRSDKNWRTQAGEFNTDLDLMRTKFSEKISDVLKQNSPEYKQVMDEMAERSKNLEYLAGRFGRENDPTAGVRTLASLKEQKNPSTEYLKQQLKKHAAYMQDESVPNLLQNWERGNELLERMRRGEDLSQELFPEDVKALQDIEANKTMAENVYQPMARMTPGTDRSQSVIRRYNYPTASIEDRRALQAIGENAGVDLPGIIKSKNIYEAFDKDATAGSRMTMAGTMLGGVPGAVMGFIGDRFGGQMLRGGIKGGVELKNTLDAILTKIQSDPNFRAKFGGKLGSAGRLGAKSMITYHHLMMNNDPEYRAYFKENP